MKLKEKLLDNKYVFLTVGISIFIFFIIYALKSIIPIGNNTMLTVDFYHQYSPLLAELYDKIKMGDNLIYSFNTGLGLPFFRNFFNYLSSPFNIIILLFERDNIVTSFSVIIALKIIFATGAMSYFLKNFFNKNSLFITLFGLTYGFSSYFVAFYWNIMWLDGIIYLPLVVLGIKKIIDDDKFNFYIIFLFLSILSNYFIGYMICIFSCIFFLVYIIFKENITRRDLLKKIILFTFSSLIAGGMAGFMIFPYVNSLSSISATGDTFTFHKTFNFNPNFFLANHFSLVKSIVFSSQDYFLPNVSSGITVLVILICFFFNSDIKIKNKIMAITFMVILFISFIYVPLDFIWHGFHTPNDLPFRYSFIYVFIVNTIAFYSITKIDTLKIRYSIIITFILSIFLFILEKIGFMTKFSFEINILFLLITFLLFIIYKIKNNNIGKFILMFLIIIDIILNINENWNINHDNNEFMDNYIKVNSSIERIKEEDKSFYRIEKNFNQTLNDGAWYNYNGVSAFSSVIYEKMAKTQKQLGLPGNDINSYYYRQNTPIYNSIMSIKYFIELENLNPLYEFKKTINYYNIYQNKYYLPPIFAVSKNIKNLKNENLNPFLNQQEFVEKTTDIDNIFTKLEFYTYNETSYKIVGDYLINLSEDENNPASINIKAKYDGNIYLYIYDYNVEKFLANNRLYSITKNEPYIIDIGYFDKDQEVNINIPLKSNTYSVNILAYQMNIDKFNDFYNKLKENSIDITEFRNDYIEGNINVDSDKTVFTSFNYDEGFEVIIDDQKVKTFSVANSFLAFDISSGKHNIKISYKVPYLKLGTIISGISLTLFILVNILNKHEKRIKN